MARNEEKQNTALNRYLQSKDDRPIKITKRPYLSSECHDLYSADKWRQQILREISRKVMEIQNPGLGEHRLRDLNDEINKLIREKGHWERRILELGGPDYAKLAPKITDADGTELQFAQRGTGYRYFGAAKQLPGVKELFEKPAPKVVKRTRAQLHRQINLDYFGLRDEDDGELVKVETEAKKIRLDKMTAAYEKAQKDKVAVMGKAKFDEVVIGGDDEQQAQFVAYVPLPDSAQIQNKILKDKKEQLMQKYASESLQKAEQQSKQLLNKQP